jgi:hypothetical protein
MSNKEEGLEVGIGRKCKTKCLTDTYLHFYLSAWTIQNLEQKLVVSLGLLGECHYCLLPCGIF